MAKFTLTIETTDSDELAEITSAIAAVNSLGGGDDLYGEDEAPTQAQNLAALAAEPQKRTRRTKAQIAADEAAARQPAPPKDDFSAQVRESAAEVAAETQAVTGVTLEQLKGAMEKLTSVMPPLEIQKLLIESFNVKGAGALQPSQYDACFAMLGEAYALAGGK